MLEVLLLCAIVGGLLTLLACSIVLPILVIVWLVRS